MFESLPDETRVWIYGFPKPLDVRERGLVQTELDRFIPQWMTHGRPVTATYRLLEDRLLILAAHHQGGISGCSIDSSVAVLKNLQRQGVDALDGGLIFFRDQDGRLQSRKPFEFQDLVASQAVGPDTPVFDTTVSTLGELRDGRLELPLAKSWHARAFGLQGAPR